MIAEIALFMLRQAITDERVSIESAAAIPLDIEHLQTLYRRAIIVVNPENPTAAMTAGDSGGASMMARQLISTPMAHIRDVLVQNGVQESVCALLAYANAGLERAVGDVSGHPRHYLKLLDATCNVGRWVMFDANAKVQEGFLAALQSTGVVAEATEETYTPFVKDGQDVLQASASTLRQLCAALASRKTLHVERPDLMGIYAQRAARGVRKGIQGTAGKFAQEEKAKAQAAHLAVAAPALVGAEDGADDGGGGDEGYDDEGDDASDSSSVDLRFRTGGGAVGEYLAGFDEEVRARVRVYFNRLRIVPPLSGTAEDLMRADNAARDACRGLTGLLQLLCESNYVPAKRELWSRGTERALSGRPALKAAADTADDPEPDAGEADGGEADGGVEGGASEAPEPEVAAGQSMLHDDGHEAAASVSVVKELIALGDAMLRQMVAGSRQYGLMYGSRRMFLLLCRGKQGDVAALTAVLAALSEFVQSSEEVEAVDVNPDEEREGAAAEAVQAAREKAIAASKQTRRRLNLAMWALVMQALDYVVEEDALQVRASGGPRFRANAAHRTGGAGPVLGAGREPQGDAAAVDGNGALARAGRRRPRCL